MFENMKHLIFKKSLKVKKETIETKYLKNQVY